MSGNNTNFGRHADRGGHADLGGGTTAGSGLTVSVIDAATSTWNRRLAWVAMYGAGIAALVAVGRFSDARFIAPLAMIAAMFSVAGWRAGRMRRKASAMLAESRSNGRFAARVQDRHPSGFQTFFSDHTADLIVDEGWVRLAGHAWPAESVSGAPPSWWWAVGIRLSTPTGLRQVSLAPAKDPAAHWSPALDRPATEALAAVLAINAGRATTPPAAWYPDPWGTARWRWWDGASWTSAQH